MREQDVLIGGEESGGIGVKGFLPERDGILIGLLHLEKQKADQDTIALWQESLDADPAALFAADQDVLLPHQPGDVLESDGQIEERQAEASGDSLGDQGVGEGAG